MTSIRVHFDGRVFVPDEPVTLPVGTPAETHIADAVTETPRVDGVIKVLAERYASGDKDVAARHDEHQP